MTVTIERDGSRLLVSGPLTMETVPGALDASRALLAGADTVDLAGVTEVDSAALGLILEWQRAGASRDVRLAIAGAPRAFDNLARLYGVDEFLARGA